MGRGLRPVRILSESEIDSFAAESIRAAAAAEHLLPGHHTVELALLALESLCRRPVAVRWAFRVNYHGAAIGNRYIDGASWRQTSY